MTAPCAVALGAEESVWLLCIVCLCLPPVDHCVASLRRFRGLFGEINESIAAAAATTTLVRRRIRAVRSEIAALRRAGTSRSGADQSPRSVWSRLAWTLHRRPKDRYGAAPTGSTTHQNQHRSSMSRQSTVAHCYQEARRRQLLELFRQFLLL